MKYWNIRPAIQGLAFIILSGFGGAGVFAQATDAEQGQIVIDDLSKPELRAQIERVQDEFYKVFNANNEDDDFDITCHKVTVTGTNIPEVACEPNFMIQRRGRNANDYKNGTDELLSGAALLSDLQPSFALLTEKMNAFGRENEYFRELNQVLQMLRSRLAELEQ